MGNRVLYAGRGVALRARRKARLRLIVNQMAYPKAIDLFLLPFRYPNAATPMFLRWW